MGNRVAEMFKKITKIELKCNLPTIGFFALKLSQDEGLGTITPYDLVYTNHGDHFDPSTGIFTTPVNGLYSITIMTGSSSNTKTNAINCRRIRKETYDERIFFHDFSINQTVTRFAEISAGDELYLNWERIDEHDQTMISVTFSCYLIQKL
ncbi:unnamed protein product [Lymnaea stagnalis]|uniref:C1q domain-containing protein n=1 Tax=Lymnaea stagnalis TaxID=6523 RepID=A0AAV2I878_LYMST